MVESCDPRDLGHIPEGAFRNDLKQFAWRAARTIIRHPGRAVLSALGLVLAHDFHLIPSLVNPVYAAASALAMGSGVVVGVIAWTGLAVVGCKLFQIHKYGVDRRWAREFGLVEAPAVSGHERAAREGPDVGEAETQPVTPRRPVPRSPTLPSRPSLGDRVRGAVDEVVHGKPVVTDSQGREHLLRLVKVPGRGPGFIRAAEVPPAAPSPLAAAMQQAARPDAPGPGD
ncbi:MAG: hypothetical protein ACR2GX_09045 [Candidatus Dormibacteria bacterium]|uniref:Uncharacterized protein n=1 Tax=Candidatus Aeolococcus gillhamiae TaxID=3127015 RepID=A0A2W6AHB8_9BACT|nr:MAG: hypothetical protein DLM65_02960 [Candidatus Dormibacter sp. RRmetagenome_bin12]